MATTYKSLINGYRSPCLWNELPSFFVSLIFQISYVHPYVSPDVFFSHFHLYFVHYSITLSFKAQNLLVQQILFTIDCFCATGLTLRTYDHNTIRFYRATPFWARYMLRQFRQSVCPSVTRVLCIKTAEHIIKILSLPDRPIILVFVTKNCYVNLTASPLTGAPNTRGIAIFDQYATITRKR